MPRFRLRQVLLYMIQHECHLSGASTRSVYEQPDSNAK